MSNFINIILRVFFFFFLTLFEDCQANILYESSKFQHICFIVSEVNKYWQDFHHLELGQYAFVFKMIHLTGFPVKLLMGIMLFFFFYLIAISSHC
jgi:hypothetical protein